MSYFGLCFTEEYQHFAPIACFDLGTARGPWPVPGAPEVGHGPARGFPARDHGPLAVHPVPARDSGQRRE